MYSSNTFDIFPIVYMEGTTSIKIYKEENICLNVKLALAMLTEDLK